MKFVVVVNAKAPLPVQMNAVGHLCLGLGQQVPYADLAMRGFKGRIGGQLAFLTDHPLIVMSARNGQHLLEARDIAVASGLACNVFLQCMTTGSPEDQEVLVEASDPETLDYVGICLFGDTEQLRPITRRFSLVRVPTDVPAQL